MQSWHANVFICSLGSYHSCYHYHLEWCDSGQQCDTWPWPVPHLVTTLSPGDITPVQTTQSHTFGFIAAFNCTALHCILKEIDIVFSPPVRMIGYVSEHQKSDHLIHPPDKKNNPWTEKVSREQCNLMQIDKYDWWLNVEILLFILTFQQKSKKEWNYKILILFPRRVAFGRVNHPAIGKWAWDKYSNWKPIIFNSRTSAVSAASRRDA